MGFCRRFLAIFASMFLATGLFLVGCAQQEPSPETMTNEELIAGGLNALGEDIKEDWNEMREQLGGANGSSSDSESTLKREDLAQYISFDFSRAEPIDEDEHSFYIYGTLTNNSDMILNVLDMSLEATMSGENKYRQQVSDIPAEVDSFNSYDGGTVAPFLVSYGYGYHNAGGFFDLQPHESREIYGTCEIRPEDSSNEATQVDDITLTDAVVSTDFIGEHGNLAAYDGVDLIDGERGFLPVAAFPSDVHGEQLEYSDGHVVGTLTNNSNLYLDDVCGIYLYEGQGYDDDGEVKAYYEFEFEPVAPGDTTPLKDDYAPLCPYDGTYTLVGVLAVPSLEP